MSNKKPTKHEFVWSELVWAMSGKTEHLARVIEERKEDGMTLIQWDSNRETALVPTNSIIPGPNSEMGRTTRGGRASRRGNAASSAAARSSTEPTRKAKKRVVENTTETDDKGSNQNSNKKGRKSKSTTAAAASAATNKTVEVETEIPKAARKAPLPRSKPKKKKNNNAGKSTENNTGGDSDADADEDEDYTKDDNKIVGYKKSTGGGRGRENSTTGSSQPPTTRSTTRTNSMSNNNKPTNNEFVWAMSGKTEHLAIVLEEKGEKTLIKWCSNGETALVPTSSIIPNSDMGRRGRGRGSRRGGASASAAAASCSPATGTTPKKRRSPRSPTSSNKERWLPTSIKPKKNAGKSTADNIDVAEVFDEDSGIIEGLEDASSSSAKVKANVKKKAAPFFKSSSRESASSSSVHESDLDTCDFSDGGGLFGYRGKEIGRETWDEMSDVIHSDMIIDSSSSESGWEEERKIPAAAAAAARKKKKSNTIS